MLLDVVYKFITVLITASSAIVSVGIILNEQKPKLTAKNIMISASSILFCSFFYTVNPQINILVFFLIPMITSLILIYKTNFILSIILTMFSMILLALFDSVIIFIFLIFSPESFETIRNNEIFMIFANLLVSIMTVIFSYLIAKTINKRKMKNELINIIMKNSKTIITFFIITVILAGLIILFITTQDTMKTDIIGTVSILLLIFLLFFLFIKDKIKLQEVTDKYDRIYTYVKTFENWIEEEQLVRHEYKNTLSKLLEITKEPEVTKEINKLLKANVSIGKDVIELISAIPKGGLKGILYYKISMAKENKVKMYVNVSETVKNKFKKFSKADYKTLCFLIGIFCDNAIEAASKSKKKQISVEIYYQQDKFHFVISNSTDVKVDLNKIENKGESTKGKGRGSGLYFAKKLLSNNSQFIKTTKQQQNYFIQELIY